MEISVVFPAYNEAEKLGKAVEETIEELKKVTASYEVMIAEDGSTDGTDEIAARLSKKYPFVRHIHRDKRLGRGQALKNSFKKSRGEILVYMDVDLATDISYLETLVGYIREDYDIASGSRMLQESRVERRFSRTVVSGLYNSLVRVLLDSKIKDHQCGFKAFKREPLLDILDEVTAVHWFWDTEILVRCCLRGYKIKEFPVKWRSKGETKVNLLEDCITMGIQVLKLWSELKVKDKMKEKSDC
ncbi:MAG: dolichyl-phosphate beta-glucosyltransferase [Candidatus Bathyarchaeia archaeon]